MSKSSGVLKSLTAFFPFKKKALRRKLLQRLPKKLSLGAFQRVLAGHLRMFDSGVELLDQRFPILEGDSEIDLLACNNLGELILIWTFHNLPPDRLIRLLSEYQWVEKNKSLFEHLFPQVKKDGPLGLKVWCFASDLEPEIKSALTYLNGINIRFFEYAFSERKGKMMLELLACEFQAPVVSPEPVRTAHGHLQVISNENPSVPHENKNRIAAITPEEVEDLMAEPGLDEFMIEDEITEPHFQRSNLDPEQDASAG